MTVLDPVDELAALVGGLPALDADADLLAAIEHRRQAGRTAGPRARQQAAWHTRQAAECEQRAQHAQRVNDNALAALRARQLPERHSMNDMITTLRASRDLATDVIRSIREAMERDQRDKMTDTESSQVEQAIAQRTILDGRIVELEGERASDHRASSLRAGSYGSQARVGFEARTYNPQSAREGVSFFGDAFAARQNSDMGALERQQRHGQEVRADEKRATSSGSFGGLVVPQYLVEEAALVVRAGRPIANSVKRMPLPEQGTIIRIPLGTTGASVASQAAENTTVSSTDETWNDLVINLVTIAGQQDVSRQSLERGMPGIDQLIYSDLAAAYATELDRQLINGSGASGQMLGILNTSGINKSAAFGAPVAMSNVWPKIGGQNQQIMTTRFLPADVIYMHPRRFAWFYSQLDASGRPLVTPASSGPYNAMGVLKDSAEYGQISGTIQGLPVIQDPSIPFLGTNGEDVIIVARAEDIYLWEDGDGMPNQLRFEQTLGQNLTVKLVSYGYVAATAGRYPKAIGIIGGQDTAAGNGLIAPTNLS